jgi:hypothetical protein
VSSIVEAMGGWDAWERKTKAALADPQVGDRFQEMLSFWLYVVHREGDQVITMEAGAPCTFPDDARTWRGSVEEFQRRWLSEYSGKPTVLLEDRGNDVSWWPEDSGSSDG